jgi:hypothetical protein
MSHESRPKGVPAAYWPAPASEPRRERPACSAEASTNYFSVAQSFVVGLRIFAEGELVPASDRRKGRPRAPHPELRSREDSGTRVGLSAPGQEAALEQADLLR